MQTVTSFAARSGENACYAKVNFRSVTFQKCDQNKCIGTVLFINMVRLVAFKLLIFFNSDLSVKTGVDIYCYTLAYA